MSTFFSDGLKRTFDLYFIQNDAPLSVGETGARNSWKGAGYGKGKVERRVDAEFPEERQGLHPHHGECRFCRHVPSWRGSIHKKNRGWHGVQPLEPQL